MNRELADLGSAKVQTTAWISFRVDKEDENRNVIEVNKVTFHNGRNQFNPEELYTKVINQQIPSGFFAYGKFAYGKLKIH